jgi:hypothetical protein
MLAEKLEQSLHDWHIDKSKILMVVTDNGANMVKAVKTVKMQLSVNATDITDTDDTESDSSGEEETGNDFNNDADSHVNDGSASDDDEDEEIQMAESVGLARFPCVAHTLQLVLKEIDKIQSYSSLIIKARAIVRKVRVSSVATEKLLSKSGRALVTDCSTRWNSVYLMISRLVEIKSALNEVLEEMQWDSLLNNEWSRLTELTAVLKPFKEQTDIMQQDNLSLSYVCRILLCLRHSVLLY